MKNEAHYNRTLKRQSNKLSKQNSKPVTKNTCSADAAMAWFECVKLGNSKIRVRDACQVTATVLVYAGSLNMLSFPEVVDSDSPFQREDTD